MLQVSELMSRELVTIHEQATLAEIRDALWRNQIRHLPVVRGKKLLGLVTHRDLLRALGLPRRDSPLRAHDLMNTDVLTVAPETSAQEAIRAVLSHKYGCLPVIDKSGDLIGIVTEADFVRYAQQLIERDDRLEFAQEFDA